MFCIISSLHSEDGVAQRYENIKKRVIKKMHKIDLGNCKNCTEKRCDLAFLQETPEELEEIEFKKKTIKIYNEKLKAHWIKEKKYWRKFADREMALTRPDKNGNYTCKSDWIHDANWYIAITSMMREDELYYNSIKY